MGMKIWLAASPELCPGPTSEMPCCTNDADSTINYGDDNTGDVVSMQPDGTLAHRPNGTKGPFETCTADPSVNVFNYRSGQNLTPAGVPFKVRYRGR